MKLNNSDMAGHSLSLKWSLTYVYRLHSGQAEYPGLILKGSAAGIPVAGPVIQRSQKVGWEARSKIAFQNIFLQVIATLLRPARNYHLKPS